VVSPFPCRYLGIPLSLLRLKRVDEQALVDRVAAPGRPACSLRPDAQH
jgi:hypothetical protein